MGRKLDQSNRPGAGSIIGTDIVAKSAPDGYTLLVSTAALPVSAHVYPNLKYDTAKDFASVTVMPCSPASCKASFTSSSLNGLMIAMMSFM